MESNEKRLIDAAWALTRAALDIPKEAVFNRANLTKAKKILPNTNTPESLQLIDALESCLAESERSEIVPGEYIVDHEVRNGPHRVVNLCRVSVYEVGGELFWNFAGKSTVKRAEDYPLVNPRKIA